MGFFSFLFTDKVLDNTQDTSDISKQKVLDNGKIVDHIDFKKHHSIEQIPDGVPWKNTNETYEEYTKNLLSFFSERFVGSKIADIEGCIVWKVSGKTFFYRKIAEDKRLPYCPNCGEFLDKIPERKKKCPHCGRQIYTFSWNGVKELRAEEIGDTKYDLEYYQKRRWELENNGCTSMPPIRTK